MIILLANHNIWTLYKFGAVCAVKKVIKIIVLGCKPICINLPRADLWRLMSPSLCFIIIVGVSDCILLFYGSKLVFKDLRLYCLFIILFSILLFLLQSPLFFSHNTYTSVARPCGLHSSGKRENKRHLTRLT